MTKTEFFTDDNMEEIKRLIKAKMQNNNISSRQTKDASTQTEEDIGLPPCNCKKNLVAFSIRRLVENVPDNRLMEFLNDVEILLVVLKRCCFCYDFLLLLRHYYARLKETAPLQLKISRSPVLQAVVVKNFITGVQIHSSVMSHTADHKIQITTVHRAHRRRGIGSGSTSRLESQSALRIPVPRPLPPLKKKRKRWWVRNYLLRRQDVLSDLCMFDGSFINFLRMSKSDFEYLLQNVGPFIEKQDTNLRSAVTAETRLAITLRYLATGDSYSSLSYTFRVSKQLISRIIPEVCKNIIRVLKNYIQMVVGMVEVEIVVSAAPIAVLAPQLPGGLHVAAHAHKDKFLENTPHPHPRSCACDPIRRQPHLHLDNDQVPLSSENLLQAASRTTISSSLTHQPSNPSSYCALDDAVGKDSYRVTNHPNLSTETVKLKGINSSESPVETLGTFQMEFHVSEKIVICCHGISCLGHAESNIVPIYHSPGIYFEPITNINFYTDHWKTNGVGLVTVRIYLSLSYRFLLYNYDPCLFTGLIDSFSIDPGTITGLDTVYYGNWTAVYNVPAICLATKAARFERGVVFNNTMAVCHRCWQRAYNATRQSRIGNADNDVPGLEVQRNADNVNVQNVVVEDHHDVDKQDQVMNDVANQE
ncbi:hypothetical protein HW555_012883 [Spodoptera exigua]|uniref:DDE Tnp4 domain-containing protein n=1 Tax=Spodoptera exigua TaxID=7107 RepID=A0A835G415_SPOEX|nr:hypothetical protein HW555_012883 [Spodoptera exigua]